MLKVGHSLIWKGGDAILSTLYLGTPNEKQKLFLKAKVKHIGYGGARG